MTLEKFRGQMTATHNYTFPSELLVYCPGGIPVKDHIPQVERGHVQVEYDLIINFHYEAILHA